MKNTDKCLITGGAGFIGSYLCDALIKKRYDVYCADNLITGSEKNIQHLFQNPFFHFIKHDVTIPLSDELLTKLTDLRYIYHLASPASPPQYQKYWLETLLVNSLGTLNMLKISYKTGAKFLFSSTSEVYGDPRQHPQKESYWGNVNPIGVRACYDESKRFGETLVSEFVRKKSVNARIVRIFNTYGPRMQASDGRVIVNFINQALRNKPLTIYGDGTQTRSFCYILDMVEGIILAMERQETFGKVINLGYPKEHTINEIAQIILKLTNSSSNTSYQDLPQDDPVKRKPDITLATQLLNWKPKVILEDGLKETIEYFK